MSKFYARGLRALAVVCLVASTAACATVTRGTKTDFTVKSTPDGAKVATSRGGGCDATPCTFKMPRKNAFTVTVTKKGYKPATANVDTKIGTSGTAGLAGNVLLGGIIGIAVDAGNGSMNDLTPNPLIVTLEPDAGTAEAAPAPTATPAAMAPAAATTEAAAATPKPN